LKSSLNILHLEDDPLDTALIRSTLKKEGIACKTTNVQNEADFVAALERGGIDLILSDFALPTFDGLSATEIVRARWPEVPVIMVSGTLGEEQAIDSLKRGATDYVLKERLSRLAPAVRRAMLETEMRLERRRLEAQIIEGQKMEVVGRLSAAVAHDFNNILAVIMGYSTMLALDLDAKNPIRKYAEEIQNASERATSLTRQLLIYSRRQAVNPVVLDLNDVVNDLKKMLERLTSDDIEIKLVSGKQIGRIKADPGSLGQVLMNLAVNARDAMPEGGRLTIATKNVTIRKNTVGGPAPILGNYVMLSVRDTGTGMTDEVKSRLFEPFFTTKAKGKGSGLGLAICQTLVKQSGGHIVAYSEVGKGTTFEVYFPRTVQPLDTATRPPEPAALPRGTETILLVEDDLAVRTMTRGILETQGYTVLSAANGQEGLDMVGARKESPIRLVLTDVMMPVMGGHAMAAQLKRAHPNLKVLFTSGYTEDTGTQQRLIESGAQFLPKPYSFAKLALKVRNMLDN
jgi:signal transduction histidine kinase